MTHNHYCHGEKRTTPHVYKWHTDGKVTAKCCVCGSTQAISAENVSFVRSREGRLHTGNITTALLDPCPQLG